ncbi:unnamed protein product [Aspergillus oryzae var. brunneus]|uniref:Unnamed protein product n=1 Tax=Aspergillus oryzae var. brunneus TaxID=332754 RepID=A0ABQ6KY74_ASPOZ|nr:unnamed protein product [Aspergillus oryzae]GMG47113.1 unnamed protein product [Aspergillus oryzae var. brunneus]
MGIEIGSLKEGRMVGGGETKRRTGRVLAVANLIPAGSTTFILCYILLPTHITVDRPWTTILSWMQCNADHNYPTHDDCDQHILSGQWPSVIGCLQLENAADCVPIPYAEAVGLRLKVYLQRHLENYPCSKVAYVQSHSGS